MFTLSASVSMISPELPLIERVRMLRDRNLGVGLWDPAGLDPDALAACGARISIMDGFGTGTIARPDSADAMLASAEALIPTAHRFGSPLMNLHGAKLTSDGPAVEPITEVSEAMFETSVRTLLRFAELGKKHDVVFGLENLNPIDHPGVPFASGSDVIELVRRVDNPHVRVNFDVYHAARGGEDVAALLNEAVPFAAEVQLADSPTRHWPGQYNLDFSSIATQLNDLGYQGSVALEAWILQDVPTALEEFITLFGKDQT